MKKRLSIIATTLLLSACAGENNCFVEGCTNPGVTDTDTTTTTTTSSTTQTGSTETGGNVSGGNTEPQVIIITVPSSGGDTTAGGGTLLQDAPTDNRPSYDVPELSAAPTINGLFNAREYDGLAYQRLDTRIIADNSLNDRGGATTRIGWHGGDLYVATQFPDRYIRMDSAEQVYQDDSTELYLDLGAEFNESYDANDYQILARHFRANNSSAVRWQFGLNSSNTGRPALTYACLRDASNNTNCEYRVSGLGLYAGRTIGFDQHINDDDDGGSRDHKHGFCAGVNFSDQAWFRPAALCRLVIR